MMKLHPPQRLTLAAGPENGGYAQIATRYRDVLARDGITVQIRHTAGSLENARLLSEGSVDAAILQGGIAVADPEIEAIGAIFSEPMSFLARRDRDVPKNPALWQGMRITSGAAGSGTAAAFQDFQEAVGLAPEANTHLSLGYEEALAGLADGSVDIAAFVAPVDAPYLVSNYGQIWVEFLNLDHVEAIARRLEYARTVTLPDGAISLRPVLPREPRRIIALEARLAVSPDLHPALANRLTMAAIEIHGVRGLLNDPGTFPSVEGTDLPVNSIAQKLILDGPSIWHDYLPYWIAAQLNRMLLLLLPILFILLPLLRILPAAYAYLMGWRVWQHYPEIRRIEEDLESQKDETVLAQMDDRLDELEERLSRLRLPAAYRQSSYNARIHIGLVRDRIAQLRRTGDDGQSGHPQGQAQRS
jgi:TRAP-type uncharacterized transport system substrate-binding protein